MPHEPFNMDLKTSQAITLFLSFNADNQFYWSPEQKLSIFKEQQNRGKTYLKSLSGLSFFSNGKSHQEASPMTLMSLDDLRANLSKARGDS